MNWGIAANRTDVVQKAFTHLRSAQSTRAEIHRLRAWLFSRRGDTQSEQRELECLVAVDPSDLTALDRLAELAEKDGQHARGTELRDRRLEIERLLTRYERLYDRKQPIRDAMEMAQLAEQLGREVQGASVRNSGRLGRPRTRGPAARPGPA